jgi:hypothetical protein
MTMITAESVDDLDPYERDMLRAIRDAATEIGQTTDRARKSLMAKYGLNEKGAQLAITFAIEISKTFSAKLALGGSFDDCDDLDDQILQAIRKISRDQKE